MFLFRPILLTATLFIAVLASTVTSTAIAALPVYVDGEPLPSLAPMIEKIRPAVVNIATRGSVDVKNHPLLNDPLFRRFFKGFENMP